MVQDRLHILVGRFRAKLIHLTSAWRPLRQSNAVTSQLEPFLQQPTDINPLLFPTAPRILPAIPPISVVLSALDRSNSYPARFINLIPRHSYVFFFYPTGCLFREFYVWLYIGISFYWHVRRLRRWGSATRRWATSTEKLLRSASGSWEDSSPRSIGLR